MELLLPLTAQAQIRSQMEKVQQVQPTEVSSLGCTGGQEAQRTAPEGQTAGVTTRITAKWQV